MAAPTPVPEALAEAAQQLAREIKRHWQREEAQRRVHDPFRSPCRSVGSRCPEELTDCAENVQRLGPGAMPRPLELIGDRAM